jgi:hypothetical protein
MPMRLTEVDWVERGTSIRRSESEMVWQQMGCRGACGWTAAHGEATGRAQSLDVSKGLYN